MLSTCVKHAEIVGRIRSFAVNEHPHTTHSRTGSLTNRVYKSAFLPILHHLISHDYPQQKTTISYLLHRPFSPLSPIPITITTT